MTRSRQLTVDARRGVVYDGFWWVFIEGDDGGEVVIRRVHSLDEVRELMSQFGCTAVVWTKGSYEEMVEAGVAPEMRPTWLQVEAG